jgi:hypothetical protein
VAGDLVVSELLGAQLRSPSNNPANVPSVGKI